MHAYHEIEEDVCKAFQHTRVILMTQSGLDDPLPRQSMLPSGFSLLGVLKRLEQPAQMTTPAVSLSTRNDSLSPEQRHVN